MTKRWSGVFVLALALTAYGCDTANGGDVGPGGSGGSAGSGGEGGMGGDGGVGGAGGMPDLCMDVDCDDGNECTEDLCDPADGTCDNPAETDGTMCDFEGVGGICMSGVCEDAGLCDGIDCSDGNECTEDLCDPVDGSCDNPAEMDGTVCDFGGVGGVCMSGVCEDAMLCDGIDCDDGNDCTIDDCDPVDGSCVGTPEMDGTICDASGLPGACDAGVCVATCAPTAGITAVLPTLPTTEVFPEYADMGNGFVITAAVRDVSIGISGMGANAVASKSAMDANASGGDSLIIEFFDMNGVPSMASNVGLTFNTSGVSGTVAISVDDGTPVSASAVPGMTMPLTTPAAHKIQISLPTSGTARLYWEALVYDHECL